MGNLCDKSIHISVLLIVLCAGVLCGLIFYILIDQEVGEDVSKNTTQPFLCKTTTVSLPKIASLRRAMPVTSSIKQEEVNNLLVHGGRLTSGMCPAELASEKNQVMDALLDRPQVPPDYGDVMIGLYRDKSQDVLTRAFAVQHIVLYARDLNRRGEYDPGSADARYCRKALFAAASETRTVVAAAAFRKFGVCPQSAHSGMSHYSWRAGEYYADCLRSRGVCPQVFLRNAWIVRGNRDEQKWRTV